LRFVGWWKKRVWLLLVVSIVGYAVITWSIRNAMAVFVSAVSALHPIITRSVIFTSAALSREGMKAVMNARSCLVQS
jgi:drug/metabolite transporter (DMT)-like permease